MTGWGWLLVEALVQMLCDAIPALNEEVPR